MDLIGDTKGSPTANPGLRKFVSSLEKRPLVFLKALQILPLFEKTDMFDMTEIILTLMFNNYFTYLNLPQY